MLCRGTTCASFSLFGNLLCFIVLFKSVVRCLLSTVEPALRSLHDIWSTPVAFLIFILLTSLVIVSVFIGLKSKSMLFFGAFFLIRSMLGWLFSSKIIPLPISFATFIKKELKYHIHLFYHLRLHLFPLKQFFADHLSIFFYKNGLTVCQKLFAL